MVHVKDICRSFVQYVEAPKEAIHNQVFNNGAARLNDRIKELAEIAVDAVPNTKLEIRSDADADQRTYKTDFGKFAR
ncbi:NAD-dependent dehydratase, partial [Acinetobacter baumannii]